MSMPAESTSTGIALRRLFPDIDVPAVAVAGIAADSRRIEPGFLFLAAAGRTHHGLAFAAEAVRRGAAAVAFDPIGDARPAIDVSVPAFAVPGLSGALADVANRYYRNPSHGLDVYGVSGTNGKTSVAWFIASLSRSLGRPCGYVGTLGGGLTGLESGPGLTTPDVVELQGLLAGFRDEGARAAAIEVSSHALDQQRVDGVRFRAALFTNLSRDHLDYHGSMQAYAQAKARLFLEHAPAVSIVNVDDDFGAELAGKAGGDVITVSVDGRRPVASARYLIARSLEATGSGYEVQIDSSWGAGRFVLNVPGRFNVANVLLSMAALLQEDLPVAQVCDAVAAVNAPPGRLERVPGAGQNESPDVYVDFAHTPDALGAVLTALRPHTRGRLFVVFGAGGDRDAGKRPEMGRVAERLADVAVLTSDNPRGEQPLGILADLQRGFSAGAEPVVIEDRAAAIAWAVRSAVAGDVVLLAGKGHETYQQVGTERRPFSDALVAARYLSAAGAES